MIIDFVFGKFVFLFFDVIIKFENFIANTFLFERLVDEYERFGNNCEPIEQLFNFVNILCISKIS